MSIATITLPLGRAFLSVQTVEKENGGLKFLFPNRRKATVFCLGAQVSSRRNNGFFYLPLFGGIVFSGIITQCCIKIIQRLGV